MLIRRYHIILLLMLTIAFSFGVSWIWEHGMEESVSMFLGIEYEAEFETVEKLKFVLTSTAFSILSLIVPGTLLTVLVGRLSTAYQRLLISEAETRRISEHDPLTGLANRRLLETELEKGFNPKLQFKLLSIDLDRFKSVNDMFGHAVGDRLLIEVADRVRSVVGERSCAARLGGDELAVLVYGDLDVSIAIADAIIESIQQPFKIGRVTVMIGCSIGMCCTDDATNPGELLKQADLALYEAKRQGGGAACCYQVGMLEAQNERSQFEVDMNVALESGQFYLAYQPVLHLFDNEICGYEALIRWEHPAHGNIPPVKFIPLAEETGQIVAIGRWVLEEACREAATWTNGIRVAVNISPVEFRSPLLFTHITSALAKSGLPANRLEIELTETAMVEDGPQIARVLTSLRSLGVSIAMDDFGTGYSSLAHLRDFPLDRIKIDRSFVATAATDRHSMAVVRAVTQIGRDLGIPILAEGVETESQMQLLRDIGCECAQGYLIGKPLPLMDKDLRAGRIDAGSGSRLRATC
ncbi:MAG: EAL domain-containing protein [Alphaproteobacteria bacterium]|nr:MAG: EAL domain-containing protein [Alphaproteobacteria bacterium]